jgi:hypothetical protein
MYALLLEDGYCEAAEVALDMQDEVKDLILRIGGHAAEDTFAMLVLQRLATSLDA